MENIITHIRNVLRKEGISGMDSINHCIVFIVCRMLDDDLCEKVKIDKKFSYKNIMIDEDGDIVGDQDLFDRIYVKNKADGCLIGQLVNKLGFKNIKFKMEGVQHVKEIMKKLKDFDPKKLSLKFDIIGTIYELHLKSGTSNAMRDLGQYYTNRQVIEYMIKLCDPQMDKKGNIDSILDPTMGTGGFLTMSIKYLNDKYKNKVDWVKNKNNIIGFDIDDNVKNMALLNVLLETGELCTETLVKNDTLYNDLKFNDGKILQKAKIILANEPMGLKNIVHASCCDRIKDLKMRGTKAEPLFLQLFMEGLADDGRCAVIVPDGMLFNESTLHNETRKHMIENFNLKKVISLSDDFFLNTGVKTSILFFTKDGKKTKEVEFSLIKLKNDKIDETSIISVKYDILKKNKFSLFVNKYNVQEIEKVDGIEYIKLIDICDFLQKSKRQASYGQDIGKYPFYSSGVNAKKCDEADYNNECIIIGTGGNANIKYDLLFSCSTDTFILKSKNNKLNIKYMYYYFLSNMKILEDGFSGSTIKHISKDYVSNLEIPIPDINIQNQMVLTLDLLNKNNETCKNQISELNNILKKYLKCQTLHETEKKINSVVEFIKTGKNKPSDDKKGTLYPYYGTSGITGYTDEYLFDGEHLMTPRNGTIGTVIIVNEKFFPSDHMFVIKFNKNENIKYMYYYIINCVDLDSKKHGSTIPNITKGDIEESDIKYPSQEKQKEIVKYCDNIYDIIEKNKQQLKNNELLMKDILREYLKVSDNKDSDDKKVKKDDSDSEENKKPKKVHKVKKDDSDSEDDNKPKKSS